MRQSAAIKSQEADLLGLSAEVNQFELFDAYLSK